MADLTIRVSKANTPSVVTGTTAIPSRTTNDRNGFAIQNQGTNALFVLLGDGASSTVYHFTLKGGTAAADGNGGTLTHTTGAVYQGIITTSGTAASYTVLDL